MRNVHFSNLKLFATYLLTRLVHTKYRGVYRVAIITRQLLNIRLLIKLELLSSNDLRPSLEWILSCSKMINSATPLLCFFSDLAESLDNRTPETSEKQELVLIHFINGKNLVTWWVDGCKVVSRIARICLVQRLFTV